MTCVRAKTQDASEDEGTEWRGRGAKRSDQPRPLRCKAPATAVLWRGTCCAALRSERPAQVLTRYRLRGI